MLTTLERHVDTPGIVDGAKSITSAGAHRIQQAESPHPVALRRSVAPRSRNAPTPITPPLFWWGRKHSIHPVNATPRRKYYQLRGWDWPE